MNKIATSGKRVLKGDVWHDDNGEIPGFPDQWDPPMTDAERLIAAHADADNPPMTPERLARARPVSRARFVRQKLGLSIEEFSQRYGIPLDVLRAWERHQATPDAAELAYLDVIMEAPDAVAAALRRSRAA
jgi:DNA-binding transcriptional regulator YiaG